MSAPAGRTVDDWLVVIDPQLIFASPDTSPWGSPLWAQTVPHIEALAREYGPENTVITRFVADPSLGGSWASYYDKWPFALVPDDDDQYAVVPELVGRASPRGHRPDLRQVERRPARDRRRPATPDAGRRVDRLLRHRDRPPAADDGATIRVVADACAGSSPEAHDQAIGAMALFAPQITIV